MDNKFKTEMTQEELEKYYIKAETELRREGVYKQVNPVVELISELLSILICMYILSFFISFTEYSFENFYIMSSIALVVYLLILTIRAFYLFYKRIKDNAKHKIMSEEELHQELEEKIIENKKIADEFYRIYNGIYQRKGSIENILEYSDKDAINEGVNTFLSATTLLQEDDIKKMQKALNKLIIENDKLS